MGLKERRVVKNFQDTKFPEIRKRIEGAAGFEVEMDIDWDRLSEDDMGHMFDENIPQVYFEPLILAFQKICIDDMGKEALKAGLKKVVIKNQSGNYYPDSAISFTGGVLTVDHLPNSNVGDVKARADKIEDIISRSL